MKNRTKTLKIALTVFFFHLQYLSVVAQGSTELVRQLCTELLEVAQLPSFSVAILRDGEVVYADAIGYADLEQETPATLQTQYRLASVSKLLTATALAKLVESGKLSYDDTVDKFLPDFPEVEGVTPRLLAGHLGGIGHYQFLHDKIDRFRHYPSVDAALETFKNSPRVGKPGEKYKYTTHGFTLLSAVVEKAAGEPFLEYVTNAIFAPLRMARTGPDDRTAVPATMSAIYGRSEGSPTKIVLPEDPSYKWGGGGMIGTPTDLVKLAKGYLEGFLSKDILKEMWTTQQTMDGTETGVGIAWRIGEDFLGRPIRHHAGSMGGARSVLIIYPESDLAIATTTNILWNSAVERNAQLILEAYLKGNPQTPLTDGTYQFTGALRNTETQGKLSIKGSKGTLATPEVMKKWFGDLAVDQLTIHHLHEQWWALVTPRGIFNLELHPLNGGIRGEMNLNEQIIWKFNTTQ